MEMAMVVDIGMDILRGVGMENTVYRGWLGGYGYITRLSYYCKCSTPVFGPALPNPSSMPPVNSTIQFSKLVTQF